MKDRWSEQHVIQSDNCDYKKMCRLSTLLEWMQRAGDTHLAENGILLDDMIRQGLAWMLVTVDLELIHQPRYGDTLVIETWHKGSKGVQWFRDYRIYGSEQELLAQARTVWVLVDIHKRRILRSSAFPYEVPESSHDSVGDVPNRVELPADVILERVYDMTVRQSSLDMNGHMNNARFADVCLDALTPEQLEGSVARFHITYHQEAMLGQKYSVFRSATGIGDCFISGTSEEGTRFFEACVSLH
ncbi:acyl-[acyl-carrier-protein] thioesterase [Paenibacillus marinisediminis]